MAETHSEEDRFLSAVKIITGLPKDGSFQPSNDLKLKFYAYYKQATIGPCLESKPGFWDVVRRAKWDAWKMCGDMSKEDAMKGYVNTLKQVVETMTLSSDVQDFLGQLGPMYEFVTADGKTVTTHERLSTDNDYEVLTNGGGKVTFANGNVKINGHSSDNGLPIKNYDLPKAPTGIHVKSSSLSLSESPSDDEAFTDAPDTEAVNTSFTVSKLVTAALNLPDKSSIDCSSPLSIVSVSESKAVQSDADDDHQFDKLPKDRRRAASALGRALRDVPEFNPKPNEWGSALRGRTPEECNDALVKAWEAVSQMRVQNLSWSDGREEKYLRRAVRAKGSTRKHRGRGSGGSGGDRDKSRHTADSDGHSSDSLPSASNDRPTDEPGRSREGRHSSGGTSSESSKDSAGFDWDPHVGAVLLRMHRELQHISRQLELMEGILITQQQMVRNVLVQSNQANKGFFFNLPWRTILLIMIWPVVVNFVARFCWFRILKKRRLFFQITK